MDESVAGLDHIERMITWSKRFAIEVGADMGVLVGGARLYDIGVVIDRKKTTRREWLT